MVPDIGYAASQRVREAVAAIGRTEDVSFSPNNRRLALAAFRRNQIAVFDIDVTPAPDGPRVALSGGMVLESSALGQPHGVDFIDDDTIAVANRDTGVAVFKLPPGDPDVSLHTVHPAAMWPAGNGTHFGVPGSIRVSRADRDLCELLVCDNTRNCVTRHQFDANGAIRTSDVLVDDYLDVPDGVAVSRDRRWVAVSNHEAHNVLIYEQGPASNTPAQPDGVLRRVEFPHGMCFTADGEYLFVADAGGPCIHIYAQDAGEWRGVRPPLATARVMDESRYLKGRENPQEGGPKGLDIDGHDQVLVVSSEHLPLGFFSVSALVQFALAEQVTPESRARDVRHELGLMAVSQQNAATARAQIDYMENSVSWRCTAPLRRLMRAVRRRGRSE
jgi:hypothetical protein